MSKLIASEIGRIEQDEQMHIQRRSLGQSLQNSVAQRLNMVNHMIRGARQGNRDLRDLKAWRRETDQLLSAIKKVMHSDGMTTEVYREFTVRFMENSLNPAERPPVETVS